MDRDDAFLTELQVNDKVKVTVNFFGQEMPFEGTCTGIADDKLSIQTCAKPEPVEFPLSAIKEGCITEKYYIPEQSSDDTKIINDNFIENIKHDKNSYYGYIVISKDFDNPCKYDDILNSGNYIPPEINSCITLNLIHCIPIPNHLPDNTLKLISDFLNICKSSDFLQTYFSNDIDKAINNFHDKIYTEECIDKTEFMKYINDISFKKIIEGINKHYSNTERIFKSTIENDRIIILSPEHNEKQIIHYLLLTLSSIHNTEFALMQLESRTKENNIKQEHDEINYYINTILKNIVSLYECFCCIQGYSTHILFRLDMNWFGMSLNREKFYNSNFFESFSNIHKSFHFIAEIITNKISLFIDDSYDYPSCLEYSSTENRFFISDHINTLKSEFDFKNKIISLTHEWSDNKQKSLIRLFYQIYNNINLFDYSIFVEIPNNEFRTSILTWIKNQYSLTDSLENSIRILFNNFHYKHEELLLKLYILCSITRIHNNDFLNIHNYVNDVFVIIKNYGNKFLITNRRYLNSLLDFFTRIITITNKNYSTCFNETEKFLLKDINSFSHLITPLEEEPISEEIYKFLEHLNTWSHTKGFSESFYQQYIPALEITVLNEAISINPELNRIFVPFKIANSEKGQNIVILKCVTTSSLKRNAAEFPINLLEILPGRHAMLIAEFSYTDLNEVFSGFDIDINLRYKFKTAWDFEKREATWETREISESFCIQNKLNHLTEFHAIRNLFRDYSSGSVIKDDRMFFGREQDIKHVIDNIRDESGRIVTNRCVCIYGQTRTGKSSLLYHIKKGLRSSPSNIIVDIGDIGSAGASEAGIKYRILSCLLEEIELEHDDICNLLTNAGICMTADPERNKTEESYFTELIGKIRSILKRKAKDTQIIILIDEFTYIYDWIKEKKLSENFMKFWKAFITNYDICAIIVGQDHMMKFINDQRFTNAFGAIRTWEVNYLKEPDACKLVTMPVSDSPDYAGQYGCTILPEAVNLLVEITSGSAYLLMNICADFIDYLNERHALTATSGHAEDFLRKNISSFEERWFEPLFNDKSDLDSDASITANKELLKKLALSYSEHTGTLEDELSLSEEEKERLHSLEARRVVEMKDGRWRITVRLYTEWLRNKFGSR